VATEQNPSPSGVWAVGEPVEIGQVHLAEVAHHRAILTTVADSVKNGGQGA
jgi:hypothetical protein